MLGAIVSSVLGGALNGAMGGGGGPVAGGAKGLLGGLGGVFSPILQKIMGGFGGAKNKAQAQGQDQGQAGATTRVINEMKQGKSGEKGTNTGAANNTPVKGGVTKGSKSPARGHANHAACCTHSGVKDNQQNSGSKLQQSAGKLEKTVADMDKLADGMLGKLQGKPGFKAVESSIDQLRAGAEQLKANPSDANAKKQFAQSAGNLSNAVKAMQGDMDPAAHNALQYQSDKLKKSANALQSDTSNNPEKQAQLFDKASSAASEVKDNLENLSPQNHKKDYHPHPHHCRSTPPNCGPKPAHNCPPKPHCDSPAEPGKKTWKVNKDGKNIELDNGYKLNFSNKDSAWTISDKNGDKTRIWGDPHVNEGNGKGNKQWDFSRDSTFVLKDGTKISVKTTPAKKGKPTVSSALTITKGDQAVQVSGIDKQNVKIGNVTMNGREIDKNTNDGAIFREGNNGVDDWFDKDGKEIKKNQAMGKQLINEIGDQTGATTGNTNPGMTRQPDQNYSAQGMRMLEILITSLNQLFSKQDKGTQQA